MVETNSNTLFEKLSNQWQDKRSMIFVNLFVAFSYYFYIVQKIDQKWQNDHELICYIFIPFFAIFLIYIIWRFTTNRNFIRSNNKLSVGIIILYEDETYKKPIKSVLNKIITYVNENFSFIKIRALPDNICKSNIQLDKYHKSKTYEYDIIVCIELEGGYFNSIEKIQTKIFGSFLVKNNSNTHVIGESDIIRELSLVASSKDWNFELQNSGHDKKKYIGNIQEVLMYNMALYLIYCDEFESAILLLKTIYNPPKDGVKITINGNKKTINLTKSAIAHGRIGAFLTELYFDLAIIDYFNKDTTKAYRRFEELSTIVKGHPHLYGQYVNMARYAYELGDIEKAKYYTHEFNKISPNTLLYYLNIAFFATIDGNISEVSKSYKKVYELKDTLGNNWIDTFEFQTKEMEKYPNQKDVFNFSLALIDYIFIGNMDEDAFNKIVYSFSSRPEFISLYELGKEIIKKEEFYKQMDTPTPNGFNRNSKNKFQHKKKRKKGK